MSELIDENQVRHVAKLARLKLTDDQIKQYTSQLADILQYVQKLSSLDTENVEPTAHAVPMRNVFRDDKAVDGIGVENVLANAPQRDGSFFAVPKVLDDSAAGP